MGEYDVTIINEDTARTFEAGLAAMTGMLGGDVFIVGDTLRDGTPVVVGGVDLGDGSGPRPLFIMVTEPVAALFREGVLSDTRDDEMIAG